MDGKYPRINLIQSRVLVRNQKKEEKKKVTSIAMIVTGVYIFLLSSVVGVKYFFSQKMTSVDVEIAKISSQISSMKSMESKYRLVFQKLDVLSGMFSDRFSLQPLIIKISNLIPDGVEMDSVFFGDAGNVLTVSVVVPDVFVLEALFDSFHSSIGNEFSKIAVLSTKRSDTGTYGLLLEFYFNEG